MKNHKWSVESFDSKPIYVVLFVSRNKDNKEIENFKERRKSFITHKTYDQLYNEFKHFVEDGVEGEMCRMYYSVNARDPQKIYTQLMHFLFDNPDFNLCSILPKLAGIAAQKECAAERKWMFDVDIDNEAEMLDFVSDIQTLGSITEEDIVTYKTPHGYAIVVNHGFDCRQLIDKCVGKDITLKRDDMICHYWERK